MKEYEVIIKYSIKADSPREAIISANGVKDSINEKHFEKPLTILTQRKNTWPLVFAANYSHKP